MSGTIENGHRQPIWGRLVLPVSLVLNIFLIALIGGHLLHRGPHERHEGLLLKRALADAEASLSAPDAAIFRSVILRDAASYSQAASELAKARDEIDRQILTEPFDKEAVKRAFAASRESWNHFTNDFADTLVDALASISPDGRQRLIMERGRGMGGPPPPP
jgi:uncharacterized membrane protein